MSTDDDHDSDDSGILPIVTPKDVFQAVVTLNKYLLQNEKKKKQMCCMHCKKLKVRFSLV